MAILTPHQIVEYLDQVAESLSEYEEGYDFLDLAYTLRDEVSDSFGIILEDE